MALDGLIMARFGFTLMLATGEEAGLRVGGR